MASEDLVNPNLLRIPYLSAVTFLLTVSLQSDFNKYKSFLFPWQEQSTGLPTCCSASTSFEVESRRRSREMVKAGHQGWKCPSWALGLVTVHSSHPHLWPPTPLASPEPLTLSHKIVLPQLIYSPRGQRLCPVVCNKARFIVHLSSVLQFSLSPWQPYSIP